MSADEIYADTQEIIDNDKFKNNAEGEGGGGAAADSGNLLLSEL